MANYFYAGAEKLKLSVVKNIPQMIYVSKDTLYRHIKDFELLVRNFTIFCGSSALAISFLLTLLTTKEFNSAFGFDGSVWHAAVLIGFIACFFISLYNAIKLWRERGKMSVDYVVNQIAGGGIKKPDDVDSVSLQRFSDNSENY